MPPQSEGLLSAPLRCGLDKLKLKAKSSAPSVVVRQTAQTEPLVAALPAGQLYQATIAIESDGEFYALFGNSSNATQYIANLFAYATTIYERETQTRLTLGEINLWTNAATDPWTFTDTEFGLYDFQDYWIANKSSVSRTTAHFLSGKNLGGGIAYLGVLCNNDYGYGLSASIRGDFSLANPQPIWDIIVVTHEIGHNFDSEHTHDYQGIGGDANPVDSCMLGGPSGPYSAGYLPGLASLSGGAPGAGNGSIMSYCHLLTGGYGNISLTFGQSPFSYGIKPYRVSDVMSSFAAQTAQNYATCLPVISSSYTLSLAKIGTGTGTVTSTPAGINCGAICSTNFNADTSVTLTASAASGSSFTGWSGCNSATGTICNVTMNAAKSVTATFNLNTFQLSVNKTGQGTITSSPAGIKCGATCVYSFNRGQSVTLTPVPSSGYFFSSWSGACSGSESCVITVDAAKSVTANFTAIPAGFSVLSVSKSGLGSITSTPVGINCSGTCNAAFANGTAITLTATPVSGHYFSGWSGACFGQGTCTVTLNSNQNAIATFLQIPANQQLLTVTVSGGGSIATNPSGLNCNTTCSYPFPAGTTVSLMPIANTGQTFTGWSGDWCTGRSSCVFNMDGSRSVSGTFKSTYSLIMPAINLLLLE